MCVCGVVSSAVLSAEVLGEADPLYDEIIYDQGVCRYTIGKERDNKKQHGHLDSTLQRGGLVLHSTQHWRTHPGGLSRGGGYGASWGRVLFGGSV